MKMLNLNLDNSLWAMSPPDFLSFKQSIDGIKQDLSTFTIGTDTDDENVPDEFGRIFISVNGALVRGTGLDECVCDAIGITDLDYLDDSLMAARDKPDCKTIVLLFNTPGGTAHAHSTALLINEIAQAKDVIGYIGSMCCSAGYELASQCSELYASETAWYGFVGTIFTRTDNTEANNQVGASYTFVTSSPKKLYLNPNASITKEELEWIESVVTYSYEQFKDVVLSNRDIDDQYLDSSIFIGEQGLKLNFIDGIINNKDELNKKTSAIS